MNVVILGCGRIGATLARSMSKEKHRVSIIDRKGDAFRRLGPDFGGQMVVGNGIDDAVLKRAGIEQADAFVAVTNGDNTNIMSVQIAKERFHVPKVAARIYDPIRACAYRELGIETICTTIIGAKLMKGLLLGNQWGAAADYCNFNEDEAEV